MAKKVNSIELMAKDLKTGELENILKTLALHNYVTRLWFDGLTYCIEYDFADEDLCLYKNVWLDIDNEYIEKYKDIDKDETEKSEQD